MTNTTDKPEPEPRTKVGREVAASLQEYLTEITAGEEPLTLEELADVVDSAMRVARSFLTEGTPPRPNRRTYTPRRTYKTTTKRLD